MKITVKLFAYFREGRFISREMELPKKTCVADIIEKLCIPMDEVGVTMLNGRHCQLDADLTAGDSLSIFPMIGGG